MRSWARVGLEVIVSLLASDEAMEFELGNEATICRSNDIEFISFPIPDRGAPASREETLKLVKRLDRYIAAGTSEGIHCRQGIGRSGLIAACLLVSSGAVPETAFEQLSETRGCPVPETTKQQEWVESFAPQLTAVAKDRH